MAKVLLVDDDIDLAELVKTKLSAEGYEVVTVYTGEGAFERAKQVKPDIAVLDIMLPGVTGYQICRRLRKDPELYRIAILILTALGEEPEVLHGLEQGADDYLAKPFKLDHLMEKLTALGSLLEAINKRNGVTHLPGTDAVKREINHRLARGMAIAACYIDVVGLKAYSVVYKKEGQQKALEFSANLLTQLLRNMGVYESYVAHLGGEHFVVLLNIEDYERFCNTLLQTFDRSVKQLYSTPESTQGYIIGQDKNGREARFPLMALSIGVAHTQFRHFKTAKKMFEVLAQTRQMAKPDGKSVMFVDRRRTDR
ncbi:MAG: response regulator [Candidatus Hydrogenedentes bacterium]|nr:response regulator [Candidatus Hydrogenedentota bacterium]